MTNFIMIFICAISLFIILFLTILLTVRARNLSNSDSPYFVFVMSSLAFWTFFFILEYLVNGLSNKILMVKLQCIGVACVPISFHLLCDKMFYDKKPTKTTVLIVSVLATLYLYFVWIDPGHTYVTAYSVKVLSRSLTILSVSYGPAFIFFQAIIICSIIYNAVKIVVKMLKSKALYRQTIFMASAILCPILATFMHKFGLSQTDWTNASLAITAILVYFSFVNYGVFDSTTYVKRNILEMLTEAIVVLTDHNTADYANAYATELLGMKNDELKGKTLDELFPGFQDSGEKGSRQVKSTVTFPGKEPLDFSFEIIPLEGPNEISGCLVQIRNISESAAIGKKLDYLRDHDETTGLFNRGKLSKIMSDYESNSGIGLQGSYICATCISNIGILSGIITKEEYKQIQIVAAHYLEKNLMPGTVLAKNGDNEYYFFSNGMTMDFNELKTMLISKRKLEVTLGGQKIGLEFKMGVYVAEEGASIEQCLSNATFALYAAMSSMSEKVVFYERSVKVRHDLYKKLISSVGNPDYLEGFVLEYQPVISLPQNKVAGAEVLVRWFHPILGKIYPDVFYSVFENLGNMYDLGYYILDRSLRTFKGWENDVSDDFCLYVNISKIQVEEENFISDLKSLLEKTEVDPKRLRLEISDDATKIGTAALSVFAKKVHETGAQVTFSNFGNSSVLINDMVGLGCDKLKLSPSLTNGIAQSDLQQVVTLSILEMSRKLGIDIIVECVENITDLNYLTENGFPLVMGYVFSRSMTDDKFIEYVINFS